MTARGVWMGTDKHVVEQRMTGPIALGGKYFVKYSDGTAKLFDPIELGADWWQMSSNAFYEKYGFNISPWDIPEIYGKCMHIVQFGKG